MDATQSFLAAFGKAVQVNPDLAGKHGTKLQVDVMKLKELCRMFHDAGYTSGAASKSLFEQFFGKNRNK